jgi:hypothetical protein
VQGSEGDFAGTERFEIVRRLGSGGMGVVYEALDREHGSHVALKTLRSSDARTILRFKQEFRALEGLHHPNLVELGDLIEDRGRWFFTMELVRGVDFLSFVRPLGYKMGDDPTSGAVARPRAPADSPSGPRFVRAPLPQLDETRLRSALVQLARGLTALHGAGKVHRDIKPSNILVTPTGRVVLLDFGLVTNAARGALTTNEVLLGTAGYMAPEQAGLASVGPAADWYAVGVLLYVALCGRLPFEGVAADILMRKQRVLPQPPSSLTSDVPADLDTLCIDLLRIDPHARPDGVQVLRRLAERGGDRASWPAPSVSRASFVGRRAELALLGAAFDEVRGGASVVVRIVGESGVGKTALVRRFGEAATADGALVLMGRCTERELVPYKAVDGVVDALSQHLERLPADVAASLLPDSATLLPQLFPVLGRLDALSEPEAPARAALDPREARARSFAALRALVGNVARMQPLVVAIDDLQWADADSLSLLSELLRVPGAPAMLLICTAREGAAIPPFGAREVVLPRLTREEAIELAAEHLARSGTASTKSAEAIAEEAAGHPMFIAELARHAGREIGGELRLDDALWARVTELPEGARDLVEVVAVAGTPVSLATAARALGAGDRGALGSFASLLRAESLIRTAQGKVPDRVEMYHDRVREAVLARVDPEARRRWHRTLALALEATGDADPEALSVQWRGAGVPEKAARWALAAAREAADSFAFERAATLATAALDLLPADHPDAQRARVLSADALANAGRGPQAAARYLAAARRAPDGEAVDLRRRAAEQLLRSGHIDEGLDVMRDVLAAVGLRVPRTPRLAVASLLWNKARLVVRGKGFTVRPAERVPAADLRRVDVCFSVTLGLSMVDVLRAADFQSRTLRLALDAGEPGRLARSFAVASGFASQGGSGGRRAAYELLREAERLAELERDPYALAWLPLGHGLSAFADGRWRECVARCDEGYARFRTDCINVAWERATAQAFATYALGFLGELRELARRVESARRDALERGDRYAAMNVLTGSSHYIRLAADDDRASRRESSEALRAWSRRGFHQQHLLDLFAQTETDLYVGDAHGAHRRVSAAWSDVVRAQLLFSETNRIIIEDLFARAEIGAARASGGARGAVLRASAARRAGRLERAGMGWSSAMARLLRAGIASLGSGGAASRLRALGGERSQTPTKLYESAAVMLDAQGMKLHAAAARLRAAGIDPRMRAEGDRARTCFAAEDVRAPVRYAAMLAP